MIYYTELRDDGYEMHNRRCNAGFEDIGGAGCICVSYKQKYSGDSMTERLLDLMDISTYSREQLIQLLDIFYRLLQQRTVTVNTQVLPTYQNHQPVVNPFIQIPGDPLPGWGTTTCGTGDTAKDSFQIRNTTQQPQNVQSSLV